MADFIRFKANGGFAMVNAEQITSVTKHIDRYDHDVFKNTHTPVFDEARTNICFAGNETDYIIVDEPFEQVCAKLTGGWKPETGTWVLKTVDDEEKDPYGIF